MNNGTCQIDLECATTSEDEDLDPFDKETGEVKKDW